MYILLIFKAGCWLSTNFFLSQPNSIKCQGVSYISQLPWYFLIKYHSITETYSGSELPGIPHQVPVTKMGQVSRIVHACVLHYSDVIKGASASQITSLTIVYSTVYSDADKKTSKLRVTGLCAGNWPGPVNSSHKCPVTRKMFPFDDVIIAQ